MKIKRMIILLAMMLLVGGCNKKQGHNSNAALNATAENIIKEVDISTYNLINLDTLVLDQSLKDDNSYKKIISLPKISGGYIGDYLYADTNIYYVVEMDDLPAFNRSVSIYDYSIKENDHEAIYSYSSEWQGRNIVKLQKNGDDLYWVEMIQGEGVQWEIHKMNLKSNKHERVLSSRKVNTGLYPIIEMKDEKLYWYGSKNEIDFMCKYDLNSKKVSFDDTPVSLPSPYTRVNPYSNINCYLQIDDNKKMRISYEKIDDGEKIIIQSDLRKIAFVRANDRYIVWQDVYADPKLYIYDISGDQVFLYDSKWEREEIYQFGFVGEYIYLVFGKDRFGYSNLYLLNSIENELKQITNNNKERTYYCVTKNHTDYCITAELCSDDDTKVLVVDLELLE